MHTPNTVKFFLRTDENPTETTWELKNSSGEVLYEGGPYETSGFVVQQTWQLEDDCFTFTINDTGGDGLLIPGFYLLYYNSNDVIHQGNTFGGIEIVDFSTADPIGIAENESAQDVLVFPNPASQEASILISLTTETEILIRVFNLNGQKVYDVKEGMKSAGQHSFMLDASSWGRGLYIYEVVAGDRIFTGKLAVN